MTTLSITDVPHQSAFAKAIASHNPWLEQRLNALEEPVVSHSKRAAAAEAIRLSMESIQMTSSQTDALAQFLDGATVITTGQQVGFLGGPLYTVYKIATALARMRERRARGEAAVTVFWIEDNDHDEQEAAVAHWYKREQGVVDLICPAVPHDDKVPVSDLALSDDIESVIQSLEGMIGSSEVASDAIILIRTCYTNGTLWSTAFIRLLQSLFGPHGVLFVSAAQARRASLMKDVIRKELEHPRHLQQLVERANTQLAEHSFHIQAKASELNLFLHVDGRRVKIQADSADASTFVVGNSSFTRDELLHVLNTSPQSFSPTVLLRPLVQDDILESAEYVAGPGEVAYLAQLPEVYEAFDVTRPRFVLRSGATVVTRRAKRSMEKDSRPLSWYLRRWDDLQAELAHELQSSLDVQPLTTAQESIQREVDTVKEYVKTIDKTLEGSIAAMAKSIDKEFENLRKKVNSAVKRKEEETFTRTRELNGFLYPNGELQERQLSPILVMSENGSAAIQSIIETIASHPAGQHYVIDL